MAGQSPTDDALTAALRAGVAIFNAGHYHAAHDAWEDVWLDLERDSPDERFLHGLIQFTAAIYHAEGRNWTGATGLATTALAYLDGLGRDRRDVSLVPVRSYLTTLATDPEVIERRAVPGLHHDGDAITFEDLTIAETTIVADVLAEELDGFDPAVIDAAIERIDDPRGERFRALLADFVGEEARRSVVYDRLQAHLQRDEQRERDVEGLFDGTDAG